METFTLSHGLQLGDALIAATALELNMPILTANVKHFGVIPMLNIEGFLPWSFFNRGWIDPSFSIQISSDSAYFARTRTGAALKKSQLI